MKKILGIVLSAVLITGTVLCLSACGKDRNVSEMFSQEQPTEATTEEVTTSPIPMTYSRVNGLPIPAEREGSRPVGIVVENTPYARPQWGFTTPALVLEYEVEGGITRMLWVYDSVDDVPEAVGPVRSARHDAAELAMGMDLIFIHIGDSTLARDLMNEYSSSFDHINGIYDSSFHHKDTTRNTATEHRSVVVGSQLAARIREKGIRTTSDGSFLFNFSNRSLSGMDCHSLYVSYSNSYSYTFSYDASCEKYGAVIDGAKRTDENGNECLYDNVIILYTDTVDLNDKSGHKDLLLENGGTGIYAHGGTAEGIRWSKPAKGSNVEIKSADGQPVTINPGVTYIGFVRSTRSGQTVVS